MMEFWSETSPRSRKQRRCDACGQMIEIGEKYAYMAGKCAGEFFSNTQHQECRKAEIGLAELHGLWGGEDWMNLGDLEEQDDLLWIQEHHPDAFKRIRKRYQHWLGDAS